MNTFSKFNSVGRAQVCECGDHGFAAIGRGETAYFSPSALPLVSGFTWGFSRGKGKGKPYARSKAKYFMHRVVLGEIPEGSVVDHINGDTLDNRFGNLRICRQMQNLWNREKHVESESGFKGVSRFRTKWGYRYIKDGKSTYVGRFDTPLEAALAYDQAILSAYGEFARTNAMLGLYKPFTAGSVTSEAAQ